MFRALSQGLLSGIAGQGALANAILESFIIHVRGLILFFYAKGPREDDVVSEDFFENPEQWTGIRPKQSELLLEAEKRANKEMAHLTYARLDVTPDRKHWPILEISKEIDNAIEVFIRNAAKDRLGKTWRS